MRTAEWFEAEDDEHALASCRDLRAEHPAIEVWERTRRVGVVTAED